MTLAKRGASKELSSKLRFFKHFEQVPLYPHIPKDRGLYRYKNTIVVCSLFAKSVHLRLNGFHDRFQGFFR